MSPFKRKGDAILMEKQDLLIGKAKPFKQKDLIFLIKKHYHKGEEALPLRLYFFTLLLFYSCLPPFNP